jgi:hypothetical protein
LRYLFTALLLCTAFTLKAQNESLSLKSEKSDIKTSDFHITKVTDARKDTSNIGYIRDENGKKVPLTFENGVATTLFAHFKNSITQDTTGTPVELVILEMKVNQKKKKGMPVSEIDIAYGFRVLGEQQFMQTSEVTVPGGKEAIEKSIRKQTEKVTGQFDKWFAENKEKVLEKPSILVSVIVATSSKDKNIIFHTKRKKLTYSNFQGRPKKLTRWGAETASGIYMEASSLKIGKRTIVKVKIGSAFHKKPSWFRKDQKVPYVLDHEQLHFDVTSYVTCQFITAVKAYKFTPENFDKELKQLYKQYDDMREKMQNDYDGQTDHGVIKEKQAEWRAKINGLLAGQDCYK